MNRLELVDLTEKHIAYLENVDDARVSEELNASYTFSFRSMADENSKYIKHGNMIKLDGQNFDIARIKKRRESIVSILVDCDHISYRLNRVVSYAEEFEGSPESIMSELLYGTTFIVGHVDPETLVYFKPGGQKSVRQCLIELANYVGGELIWDNYTVHMVFERNAGLEVTFRVGENIRGITQETDLTEGYPRYALEVDVLDLAHLPEYSQLKELKLGNLVRVIDPVLEIDTMLRVVVYEYDPFQKVTPRIQIGNVIRDITEYFKEIEEQGKTEPIKQPIVQFSGAGYFSATVAADVKPLDPDGLWILEWKVGDADALQLPGIDVTDQVNLGGDPAVLKISEKASNIKVRINQNVLDRYYVMVNIGGTPYMNDAFTGDTLLVNIEFPNSMTDDYIAISFKDPNGTSQEYARLYVLKVKITAGKGTNYGIIQNVRYADDVPSQYHKYNSRMYAQVHFNDPNDPNDLEIGPIYDDDTDWYPILNPNYSYTRANGSMCMMVDGVVIGIFKEIYIA